MILVCQLSETTICCFLLDLISRPPTFCLLKEKRGATIAASRRAGHWIQALGLLHAMHADTWRFGDSVIVFFYGEANSMPK